MHPVTSRAPHLAALLIAVALIGLGAALAWVHARFDARAQVDRAVMWLDQQHQRHLEVAGEPRFELLPLPTLRLAGVTLSEAGSAAEAAYADELTLRLELLPLLQGRVQISAVEGRGMRLSLQRERDGRHSFDDLVGRPGATHGLNLDALALRDLRLRVDDLLTGLRADATVQLLSLDHLQAGAPAPMSAQMTLDLRSPSGPVLGGEMRVSARMSLDRERNTMALTGLDLKLRGQALALNDVDLRLVSTRLRHDLRTAVTQVQDLRVDGPLALAGLRAHSASVSAATLTLDPHRDLLHASRLTARARGMQERRPFEAELQWPWLELQNRRLAGSGGQASAQWTGPFGTLVAHLRQGSADAGAPPQPLGHIERIELPEVHARLMLQGRLDPLGNARADLHIAPAQAAVALERMELRLAWPDTLRTPLPLLLVGRAEVGPRTARWQVDAALAGHALALEGQALWAGNEPDIRLNARIDTLDLDPWFAATAASTAAPWRPLAAAPAGPTRTGGPDDTPHPVDLSGLRQLKGAFNLAARTVRAGGQEFRRFDAQATLEGGMLRVARWRTLAWGGQLAGTAFADARAQRLMLRADAGGIHLHEPARWLLGTSPMHGTGRLSLEVETAGQSREELVQRLAGRATLRLQGGAVLGLTGGAAEASGALPVNYLRASFEVRNGLVVSERLDAASPAGRLDGLLAIDLAQRRAEGRLRPDPSTNWIWAPRPAPSPAAAGPAGALTDRLKGLFP